MAALRAWPVIYINSMELIFLPVIRCSKNPLIIPSDVRPSQRGLKVDGVFNAGVIRFNDEILMILRVSESVTTSLTNIIDIPIMQEKDGRYQLTIKSIDRMANDKYDFSDPRGIIDKLTGSTVYLTSISHLRLARSSDGISFKVDEKPFLYPSCETDSWGIEDPRVTKIGGTYYINYTSVSEYGPSVSLAETSDFVSVKRRGMIFLPENKDVTIFPVKIGGKYVCFTRPVPNGIGQPNMYIAKSDDLIHWGEYRFFIGVTSKGWENGRLGGGAVPFLTDKGWIEIYHAADKSGRYCLGALLLDKDNPSQILARTSRPLLEPETNYELNGFFGNVVFTCGVICEDGIVSIYYGAADELMALATISLEELFTIMA
jgi:beta-1,2-mannobiose phosphorylase / 1,2-beta-oligomannan phosphorylase